MTEKKLKFAEDFPTKFCQLMETYRDRRLQAQASRAPGIKAYHEARTTEAHANLWKFLEQNDVPKSGKKPPPEPTTLGFRPHQGELFLKCLDWLYQPIDDDPVVRYGSTFFKLKKMVRHGIDDCSEESFIRETLAECLEEHGPIFDEEEQEPFHNQKRMDRNRIEFGLRNKITFNGTVVPLTDMEFKILQEINRSPGISSSNLYYKMHGRRPMRGETRSIHTLARNLRAKLETIGISVNGDKNGGYCITYAPITQAVHQINDDHVDDR